MVIETERLSLRTMTIADLEDFLALPYSDTRVDRRRAIAQLRANEREWENRGQGILAILDGASGRLVGRVALRYWAQTDESWFGVALRPEHWGQGFATEAGRACFAWGFTDLGVPIVSALVDLHNTRSIKLLRRLGMTPHRMVIPFMGVEIVYSVTRQEWERGDGAEAEIPHRG